MKILTLTFSGNSISKTARFDESTIKKLKYLDEYVSSSGRDMGTLIVESKFFNFKQLFEKDTWMEIPMWCVDQATENLKFAIIYDDDRYDRNEAEEKLKNEAMTFGKSFRDAIDEV